MKFMTFHRVSRLCAIALVAIFMALTSTATRAMNVSPMVVELKTSGSGMTGRVQLINTLVDQLPYEVRVYRLEFTNDGKIVETPADEDFIVFPPQGTLAKDQRQMIRLQWVGGVLDTSRAYYLSIRQLPVNINTADADKTKASVEVQLLYNIKVLVTVAPPNASPKVEVAQAEPTFIYPRDISGQVVPNAEPLPGIKVTLTNVGNRYAMLAAATWIIDGTGMDGKPLRVVVPAVKMGEILGAGYLAPVNGRRTFEIPTGQQFADAPISIKFKD